MTTPSTGHSCALVDWGAGLVVVVAGGDYGGALKRVELLYLDDLNSGWQPGPELPLAATNGRMVRFKDSVVLIGGLGEVDGTKLYQLKSPAGPWMEMQQTLERPRGHNTFILIPDELTGC